MVDLLQLGEVAAVVLGLLFLLVRAAAGTTAAMIFLVLPLAGFAYLRFTSAVSETRRMSGYKDIERSFAEGCAETQRTIFNQARGDERIFVRLHGQELLTESLSSRNDLPQPKYFQPGVAVLTGDVPEGAEGILIDVEYQRDLMPGSYPGYEWQRVGYKLKATTVPGKQILAQAHDMEARNAMCIGGLEGFMRKALNRSAVFRAPSSGTSRPPLPTTESAVVKSALASQATGEFLKSKIIGTTLGTEVETAFKAMGCTVHKSTISPTYVLCGGNEVWIHDVKATLDWSNTHLLVRQVHRGMGQLTSLSIEQRDLEWRLLRTWVTNFVPMLGQGGDERLDDLSISEGNLGLTVFSNRVSISEDIWYRRKALLKVPLPGLIDG